MQSIEQRIAGADIRPLYTVASQSINEAGITPGAPSF